MTAIESSTNFLPNRKAHTGQVPQFKFSERKKTAGKERHVAVMKNTTYINQNQNPILDDISEDTIPAGGFRGEESLPPGGFRGEEQLPPGGFRGEESLPPGGFRGEEQLPPGGFRSGGDIPL